MKRSQPLPLATFVIIFVLFGGVGLFRYAAPLAHSVRTVDLLGLFGAGMGCGVGLFGSIMVLRGRLPSARPQERM